MVQQPQEQEVFSLEKCSVGWFFPAALHLFGRGFGKVFSFKTASLVLCNVKTVKNVCDPVFMHALLSFGQDGLHNEELASLCEHTSMQICLDA